MLSYCGLYLFLLIVFQDKVSCNSNWPPTLHVAKDDLELPSDGITDLSHHILCLGDQTQRAVGKHFDDWTHTLNPYPFLKGNRIES